MYAVQNHKINTTILNDFFRPIKTS